MKPQRPTPQDTSAPAFPFLLKALITVIIFNKAGIEEKKQVSAVFQLDTRAAEMPWYALRNFLVPAYLKKTLGPEGQGWKKIYEIKIEKMVNRENPLETDGIPLRVMTLEQLDAYVQRWELPVKPRDFHSVDYARQMVALFEEDPAGYQKQYEDYIAGKGRKYPELDGLRKNVDASVSESLAAEMDELEKRTPAPASTGAGAASPVNPAELSDKEKAALQTPSTPAAPAKPAPAAKPAVSRGTSAAKVAAPAPANPIPVVPVAQPAPPADPIPLDPTPADPLNPTGTDAAPADPFENV
jgi:hypothetical protein